MENSQHTAKSSEDGGSLKGSSSGKAKKKKSKKAVSSEDVSSAKKKSSSSSSSSKKKKSKLTGEVDVPTAIPNAADADAAAVGGTASVAAERTEAALPAEPEAPSIDAEASVANQGPSDPPPAVEATLPPRTTLGEMAEASSQEGDGGPRLLGDDDVLSRSNNDSSEYDRADVYQDESSSGRDTPVGVAGPRRGGVSDDDDLSSTAAVFLGDTSSLEDSVSPDRAPQPPAQEELAAAPAGVQAQLSSDDGDYNDDDDDLMDRSTTTEPSFVPPTPHTREDASLDGANYGYYGGSIDPDYDHSEGWYGTDVEERGYEPVGPPSPPRDPPPHEDELSVMEQEMKLRDERDVRSTDAVVLAACETPEEEEEDKRRWGCILLLLFAAVVAAFGIGIGIGIGVAPSVLPSSSEDTNSSKSSVPSLLDSETKRPINAAPTSPPIKAVQPTAAPSIAMETGIPLSRLESSSPTQSFTSSAPSSTPSCSSGDSSCIRATLLSLLEPALPSPRSRELLRVNGTCQNQAFDWLRASYQSLSLRARVEARIRQKFALAVLYCEWNGANWTGNDLWLSNVNECQWLSGAGGVNNTGVCDESSSLYRTLQLEGNNLVGTVPAELFILSTLEHVRLGNNLLTGTIPAEFQMLRNLQVLALNSNVLQGSVARVLESSLPAATTSLDLACNELSGNIPEGIPLWLPQLKSLRLTNNAVNGTLPTDLGSLTALRQFHVDYNGLTGTIPPALVPSRLKSLRLDHNRLGGTFPVGDASSWTELRTLSLHDNELSGSIDALCSLPLRRFTVDLSEVACECCTSGSLEDARRICQ